MLTKWCFVFEISLLLLTVLVTTVTGQAPENANILLDKATVKCVDEISDSEEQPSSEDFKWRPKSLSKMEPPIPLIIRKKCINKNLVLRLKVIDNPAVAFPESKEALLVVEEIDNDLIRGQLKSRLAYPVVLKAVQLSPSILTHPINFLYRVNAQPYEEVISLNSTKDYTGCYFGPEATRPTCGSPVGGFCCSCNSNRGNKCTKPFAELSEVMQSSAHCLRFSPYWYGVYSIDKPEIYHQMSLQLFKNEELENGTILWKAIFPEKGVTVSTQKPRLSLNSVTIKYHDDEEESQPSHAAAVVRSYINVSTSRLLVPILNPVSVSEKSELPQESLSTSNHPSLEKGSTIEDSLLLVSKSLLAPEGSECNRAGTSFPAFDQQRDPCNSPRNSCLTHQPLDLWRSGKHSIGAYGPVAKISSPITFTPGGRDGILLMENKINGKKTYFIDIGIAEWKDFNLLNRGYNPIFEFVVTDTSWNSGARVTAQIINTERIASKFKIKLQNCRGGLSGESDMKWIQPLASETFVINLEKAQGINETEECFVVILNEIQERVGGRDVKFRNADTCICSGRCKCVCVKDGVSCDSLEWEGLVAAGMADWDEEMMNKGNGTYSRDHENGIFNDVDDTVTRWWYWSIVILGFPILAFFLVGMICWFFSKKLRKNSDLNLIHSSESFPEGDKRHFSISDEGDDDELGVIKNSSFGNLSKLQPVSSSSSWKNQTGSNNQAKGSSKSNVVLPREKESLSKIFASNQTKRGNEDDQIPRTSLETMHSRRGSIPIPATSSQLQPVKANTSSRSQNPSAETRQPKSVRMMDSSPRVADSKQSAMGSYSDPDGKKSSSALLPNEKSESTPIIETVAVHQTKSSASESGNELGGDTYEVDFNERKDLKFDNHRRYGSWHRLGASASKSILELCELTSSSDSFTMNGNGRPNAHFNYD